MFVSVITPVYQAAEFVEKAVDSALSLPEVEEVILIEDGSTDGSWEVCEKLQARHPKVHLHSHPSRKNQGAGASRNLGIKRSKAEWIAFLDADDFMLPGRFSKTQEVVDRFPDCEGIYEAVGITFESEELKNAFWAARGGQEVALTTVTRPLEPDKAFEEMAPIGGAGYGHTDGWTVRKSAFLKCGLFNPSLRLHQDTDLFMRLAAATITRAGELEKAVAIRRIHGHNRITQPRTPWQITWDRCKMFQSTWNWAVLHQRADVMKLTRNRAKSLISKLPGPGQQLLFRWKWRREFGRLSVID